MKPGLPWSVKGVDPDMREAAKSAAKSRGMTLGQWLNETIERGSGDGFEAPQTLEVPVAAPVAFELPDELSDLGRRFESLEELKGLNTQFRTLERTFDKSQSGLASALQVLSKRLGQLETAQQALTAQIGAIPKTTAPAASVDAAAIAEATRNAAREAAGEIASEAARQAAAVARAAAQQTTAEAVQKAVNEAVRGIAGDVIRVATARAAATAARQASATTSATLQPLLDSHAETQRLALEDLLRKMPPPAAVPAPAVAVAPAPEAPAPVSPEPAPEPAPEPEAAAAPAVRVAPPPAVEARESETPASSRPEAEDDDDLDITAAAGLTAGRSARVSEAPRRDEPEPAAAETDDDGLEDADIDIAEPEEVAADGRGHAGRRPVLDPDQRGATGDDDDDRRMREIDAEEVVEDDDDADEARRDALDQEDYDPLDDEDEDAPVDETEEQIRQDRADIAAMRERLRAREAEDGEEKERGGRRGRYFDEEDEDFYGDPARYYDRRRGRRRRTRLFFVLLLLILLLGLGSFVYVQFINQDDSENPFVGLGDRLGGMVSEVQDLVQGLIGGGEESGQPAPEQTSEAPVDGAPNAIAALPPEQSDPASEDRVETAAAEPQAVDGAAPAMVAEAATGTPAESEDRLEGPADRNEPAVADVDDRETGGAAPGGAGRAEGRTADSEVASPPAAPDLPRPAERPSRSAGLPGATGQPDGMPQQNQQVVQGHTREVRPDTADDPRRDLAQFEARAAAGDPVGQLNLGNLYAQGRGVERDFTQAAHYYRQAADQGVAQAQYNLGVLYQLGRGVDKDPRQTLFWFFKAAEGGHVTAQHGLAVMYYTGVGVKKNTPEAVRWFREAAKQGHVDSQYNLALLYSEDADLQSDLVEAYRWMKMAADNGDGDAQARLPGLLQAMSPDQKARVRGENTAVGPTGSRLPGRSGLAPGAAGMGGPELPVTVRYGIDGDVELRRSDVVRVAQGRLRTLGLLPGQAHGRLDEATRSALRSFQANQGLPADGRLTRQTYLRLARTAGR